MLAHTKDEKYLMALYEMSQEDESKEFFDKYEVGLRAHLQPKGVNTITVLLAQANFIKKGDGDLIKITKHGESLAQRLLEE